MRYTTDKRISPRLRRKLRVVFDHDPQLAAVTVNISKHGLCVASDFVAPPASQVNAQVVLPDGQRIPFAGVVRWSRKLRGESTLGGTNNMGLRFTASLGPAYERFIDELLGLGHPVEELTPVPTLPGRPGGPPALAGSPEPAARRASPPQADARAPAGEAPAIDWPVSPEGQIERLVATVQLADLATGSERHPAGLAIARAAQWIDEASARCLAALLPPGKKSAGVGLSLTLTHRPAVAVGTRIKVEVKVTRLTARGRTLSLEARISDGARELASGQLARIVIDEEA